MASGGIAGTEQVGMPLRNALMERVSRILDGIGACETVLAVVQRRLSSRLTPDAASGECQGEVPVLVAEDDVLGIADARVEDRAVDSEQVSQ